MTRADVLAGFADLSREAHILLQADTTVIAWNPAATRLLRIGRDTAIGQRWGDLLPAAAELLAPAPAPGAAPANPVWRRHTLSLPDGGELVVEAATAWHADHQLILLTDAGPLAAGEQATQQKESYYRDLLDALPIGFTVVDLRDETRPTLYQNNWGVEISGWENEEWERDPAFSLKILHPDDRAAVIAFRDQFAAGFAPFDIEYRVLSPEGATVWLRDWGTIVHDAHGVPDHAVVCLMDVTAQKTAEQALRAAIAQLSAANAEISALSQAKSEYFSLLSHEFRTPLTSIQGFSELIQGGDLEPDEINQFAAIIQANARRLARMMSDLLAMDRLESGRRGVRWQPVALAALIDEVLATLAGLGHDHQISVTLAPSLPLIDADSDLLTQVVTNVVSNAIKYTPPPGRIDISVTRPDPALVTIAITDSGPGIPLDALEAIFQRFTRLARDERQPIEGSGLGLPIARQIVELHGGRLWAERSDAGARFVIQLPVTPPVAAPGPTLGRRAPGITPAT